MVPSSKVTPIIPASWYSHFFIVLSDTVWGWSGRSLAYVRCGSMSLLRLGYKKRLWLLYWACFLLSDYLLWEKETATWPGDKIEPVSVRQGLRPPGEGVWKPLLSFEIPTALDNSLWPVPLDISNNLYVLHLKFSYRICQLRNILIWESMVIKFRWICEQINVL